MPRHVVAPLTLHPPMYDTVRAARMWDAMRWNIKLSNLTESTLPGFYIHKGVLHEVRYELPPFPPPSPQSHVSALGFGVMSFSANAPTLVLQPVTALPGQNVQPQPFAYTMEMAFGDLTDGANANWIPGAPFPPLKFKCMVDIGGRGHMWTYCIHGGAYGLSDPKTVIPLTQTDRTFLLGKAKYPRGKEGNAYRQLRYGDQLVDVQAVTPGVTGIFDFDGSITRIPRYMYGLAIGFTPRLLSLPFDGMVGLGRSHSAPHALGGVGIVRHMMSENVIQDETFYLCCMPAPVPMIGYGFLSIGGWASEYADEPQWQEINLHQQADRGMWELHLLEVNLIVPGRDTLSEKPNCKVRLDNATTQTLLPQAQTLALMNHLFDLARACNFPSYDVHSSIEVELVFNSPTRRGLGIYSNLRVPVRGRASDFFVVPNPNPGPRETTLGSIPLGNKKMPSVLGINFFRTFILGFRDKAHGPTVLIAPQLRA